MVIIWDKFKSKLASVCLPRLSLCLLGSIMRSASSDDCCVIHVHYFMHTPYCLCLYCSGLFAVRLLSFSSIGFVSFLFAFQSIVKNRFSASFQVDNFLLFLLFDRWICFAFFTIDRQSRQVQLSCFCHFTWFLIPNSGFWLLFIYI